MRWLLAGCSVLGLTCGLVSMQPSWRDPTQLCLSQASGCAQRELEVGSDLGVWTQPPWQFILLIGSTMWPADQSVFPGLQG